MKVVILGAGPTGLGAAYALEQAGADWVLLERAPYPGGLAASFEIDGFTWDIGGHIVFSHYAAFDRMLAEVMPEGTYREHPRRAFIRLGDRWVPYPFQYNLRHLPSGDRDRCLEGLAQVAAHPPAGTPATFEEWIRGSMGAGIAELFMAPYNRKVWACEPAAMAAHWVGDRVAVPDLARIRKHLAEDRDDVDWGPNNRFRFPRRGGTGFIWRQLAARLPAARLRLNCAVTAVDPHRRLLTSVHGNEVPYDALISTAPLDQLTAMAGLHDLAALTRDLVRTRIWIVGVGLRGPVPEAARDKCWMYFPDPSDPFYRVTVFSNYSPDNAPPGHYSLMAEVSRKTDGATLDERSLVAECVAALRRAGLIAAAAEPVHTWCHRVDYGYPVPSLTRDAILDRVQPALEQLGILSRGRFGAWKYEVANMDHSFMQGVEVARRLTTGEPELTVRDPDLANARRPR